MVCPAAVAQMLARVLPLAAPPTLNLTWCSCNSIPATWLVHTVLFLLSLAFRVCLSKYGWNEFYQNHIDHVFKVSLQCALTSLILSKYCTSSWSQFMLLTAKPVISTYESNTSDAENQRWNAASFDSEDDVGRHLSLIAYYWLFVCVYMGIWASCL